MNCRHLLIITQGQANFSEQKMSAVHVARVKTLYRTILKHQWCWSQTLYVTSNPFPEQAQFIRHQFEMRRDLSHPAQIEEAVTAAEKWLEDNFHPDLPIHEKDIGGNEYTRNE